MTQDICGPQCAKQLRVARLERAASVGLDSHRGDIVVLRELDDHLPALAGWVRAVVVDCDVFTLVEDEHVRTDRDEDVLECDELAGLPCGARCEGFAVALGHALVLPAKPHSSELVEHIAWDVPGELREGGVVRRPVAREGTRLPVSMSSRAQGTSASSALASATWLSATARVWSTRARSSIAADGPCVETP